MKKRKGEKWEEEGERQRQREEREDCEGWMIKMMMRWRDYLLGYVVMSCK